jgi:hypothetical protein
LELSTRVNGAFLEPSEVLRARIWREIAIPSARFQKKFFPYFYRKKTMFPFRPLRFKTADFTHAPELAQRLLYRPP